MMRIGLILFASLLSGCARESVGPCGEGFCLPNDAAVISRQAPADFNLYEVAWHGQKFRIYEGNYPDVGPVQRTKVSLPLDSAARLAALKGEGSVILGLGGDFPLFLDVMGPCSSTNSCSAVELAKSITMRRKEKGS